MDFMEVEMKFYRTENYETMSKKACSILIDCLVQKPDSLFCIATGNSPTGSYQLFVKEVKKRGIDTSKMRIIKLDEWCGLKKDNPATCEYYVKKHILDPLAVEDHRYISFNSMEKNSEYECDRISSLLKKNGGIDCCILGLGRNGHLGLNEPSSELNPFIHKTALEPKTQTHTMLTLNNQSVSEGYTLGIKDILSSKKILMLVTGSGKKEAYKVLQRQIITPAQPANYLWLHDNTDCIVDNSCF